MIPKKICYCWFGKSSKPDVMRRCIDSWKRVLPDYTITEINESNTDMNHPFIETQYRKGQFAGVSDVARLLYLKNNPGIYLDTDVYLLKSFTDDMLNSEMFIGAETRTRLGLGVIGVNSINNDKILGMLDQYLCDRQFIPNTMITKEFLDNKYGSFKLDSASKFIDYHGIRVYNRGYFYPLYCTSTCLTDDIICFHFYTSCSKKGDSIYKSFNNAYNTYSKELHEFFSEKFPDEYNRDIKHILDIMSSGKPKSLLL